MIGAALLQATILPAIEIRGVHPDLVLLLVIGWTILQGLEEGFIWALIGGLSLDLLSGGPFGLFTLSMLLVAGITSLAHGRILGSSLVLPLGLTFPLSLFFNGLALSGLALTGRPINWALALSNVLLPVALFNTMVMVLVFPLLSLLHRLLNPRQLSF